MKTLFLIEFWTQAIENRTSTSFWLTSRWLAPVCGRVSLSAERGFRGPITGQCSILSLYQPVFPGRRGFPLSPGLVLAWSHQIRKNRCIPGKYWRINFEGTPEWQVQSAWSFKTHSNERVFFKNIVLPSVKRIMLQFSALLRDPKCWQVTTLISRRLFVCETRLTRRSLTRHHDKH